MSGTVHVAAFYRFTPVADPAAARHAIARAACRAGVRGSVLIAAEGVNGTLAGPAEGLAEAIAAVRALPGCADLAPAMSRAAAMPFERLKVRLRPEIVPLGAAGLDARRTGARVGPADWDAVLDDPGTVVLDVRNAYEIAIGRFDGAVVPETERFRDFPAWWRANAGRFAGRRVAMYCTGGIRCEKAAAWLLAEGVPEVRQLAGGILAYLAERAATQSRWRGACFVFDGRVSLTHGLAEGGHVVCHACGGPVGPEGRASPHYREGVSCPACIDRYTEADRARFAERQRQIEAARRRGDA